MLFDTEKLRRAAARARRSCRRHPFAALAGVALVVGTGSVSWLAAPLGYQSTAVVSARSDVVSSAIANPGRAVPQGADQPLANAKDTILSEANIDRIISDANLIERQQAHAGETSLGEFRRSVFQAAGLSGPVQDAQDVQEGLRAQLRQALTVQIDGGSNGPDRLTISVLWTDPEGARAIVAAAQENFLEDRHTADLGPIEAALAILERYKADADADVARLREELSFPSTETRDLPDGSPLRTALQTQAELEDRLNGARIEVDAAEAAFGYRYSVVQTPVVPRGPASSMLKRYLMTAALAVVAAVGLATARAGFRRRSDGGRAERRDVAATAAAASHVAACPATPGAPVVAPPATDAAGQGNHSWSSAAGAHPLDRSVDERPSSPVLSRFDPAASPAARTASAGLRSMAAECPAPSWAPTIAAVVPDQVSGSR